MIKWIKDIELKNKDFNGNNICLFEHQIKIREVFRKIFESIIGFSNVKINYHPYYTEGIDNSNLLNTYRDFINYKNHVLFLNKGE